jgi:FKBP12-rapamycin complex-associated protein
MLIPLIVACKSTVPSQADEAKKLLERLRPGCALLLRQTETVCTELVRVSALWAEEWHATLQDASCVYFDDSDVEGTKQVPSR